MILASWKRSKDMLVAADHIEQSYSTDVDIDTPITRRAQPILNMLRGHLDGQPMSIILTDQTGLVLSRQSGDAELDRYLDGVSLAPGFRYSEQFVGTNGIGTALEVGGPTYVFGHEHYAENLERLACVGVPIRHPISGRTVGAIDLTCWAKDAGPLLLTLAKSTAEQIRQALLADAGVHQMSLLEEYLRVCGRQPGIVFAVDGDTVIMNEHVRSALDPVDQAALVAHAGEALLDGRRHSIRVELPSGATARMYGRPVGEESGAQGAVVHVKMGARPAREAEATPTSSPMSLPGIVGADPVWLRACREVEAASHASEWLMVRGEPGVGKLALLQAAQLRHQPVRQLALLDAAVRRDDEAWRTALGEALAAAKQGLVVQHIDELSEARFRQLVSVLSSRRADAAKPFWVAVTLAPARANSDLRGLGRLFPRTVDVPPLRLHLGDLRALVSFFLGRLGVGEQLTCSPEAIAALARGAWPGNAQEVLDTLREVVRHRRTGTIAPEDLPPGTRTFSRRRLSPIEAMERDAVVRALVDSGGDKTQAAAALGMSRATIYRKIQGYGIVDVATR